MTNRSASAANTFVVAVFLGSVLALVPVQGNAQNPPGGPPLKSAVTEPAFNTPEWLQRTWQGPATGPEFPTPFISYEAYLESLEADWKASSEILEKSQKQHKSDEEDLARALHGLDTARIDLEAAEFGSRSSTPAQEFMVISKERQVKNVRKIVGESAEDVDDAHKANQAAFSAFVAAGGDPGSTGTGDINSAAAILFGPTGTPATSTGGGTTDVAGNKPNKGNNIVDPADAKLLRDIEPGAGTPNPENNDVDEPPFSFPYLNDPLGQQQGAGGNQGLPTIKSTDFNFVTGETLSVRPETS